MSTGSAEIKSAKESAFLDKEKAVFLLSAALGLILSFAFVKYSISAPDSALGIASLGNIKTYILAVLVWIAGSCAAFPILTKFLPSKDNKVFGWVILAAAGTFFLYAGFEIYQFVGKGWNPKYLLTCIVFAAGTIVVSQLCKKLPREKAQNVILVLEVLGFATLWFLSACYLNTFTNWSFGTMYNVFHSSSYIDSIANVFFGHPYRGLECDLYGHYGLFFILPLKIFGGATKTIGIIMGLLAAITFIAFAVSVMLSVKQFIVKVASLAALGLSGTLAVSIYWQSFPHRMIFPALTMLVLTLLGRKKASKKSYFIGLILPVCAVIWNFESGVLCAVAWGIYGARVFFQGKNRILSVILAECISAGVSCLGALLVLNIYNAAVHGPVLGFNELRGFAQISGHIDSIASPLAVGNEEYIHTIILCMGCALWGLWKLLVKKEDSPKVMFALATAVFGLGIITYYVNDNGGGPTIFRGYLVLSAAVVASGIDSKKDLYSLVKKGACIYACTAIFAMGAMNRLFWKDIISLKNSGAYNYEEFQAFADRMDSEIAPDTVAEGFGTSALFLAMGRDDCTDDFQFKYEDVEGAEHFVKFWIDPVDFEGYRVVEYYSYGDTCFGYFEKIEE